MANTLTNLIPDLYAALNIVSREQVGFIPSVGRNSGAERAAVGELVRYPIAGEANVADTTPSMTVPEPTDQVVDNGGITITKSRVAEFGFVGEEQLGLNNGAGYLSIQGQMIAQAMRTLTNEIETDLAQSYLGASRAYGTAGTTPFASDLNDTAQVRKILADNGAPLSGLNMVIDSTAGANMRTLTNLTKVNEANDSTLLRQGVLLDVHGFAIRESAQVASTTKGTGTGYLVNLGAGYSEGDTSIVVDTGTGTIVAGDVITFAGDTNKYIVATGVSAPGTITIAKPGLQQDLADGVALTIGADYVANIGFDREAIQLVTRAPALPQEGDLAVDRTTITDPVSGLSFDVAIYLGYKKVRYELAIAWGNAVIKPAHTAILLG